MEIFPKAWPAKDFSTEGLLYCPLPEGFLIVRGISLLLLFLPLSAQAMAIYEPMSGLDALAMIEKAENDCGQVGLKDLRIATPIFRKYHPMIAQERLMTAAWSCQQELALTNMKLTHAADDEERRGLQRLLWSLETKRDFLRQQADLAD